MEQARTLRRFLEIALQPVGRTMYVWGGGWNEQDDGAGPEAVTIGVSPRWEAFFRQQGADYDTATTRYQIHDGLDCSGYVGWAVYNLLRDEGTGYVMPSGQVAQAFAARGWGRYTPAGQVTRHTPGDIMSTKGHVYIVLGECADGSVVLVHASPPGVQICGTAAADGTSQAAALAEEAMRRHYPAWHAKYPACTRGAEYLTAYARMAWDVSGEGILRDPEGLAEMNAAEVLRLLLRGKEAHGGGKR